MGTSADDSTVVMDSRILSDSANTSMKWPPYFNNNIGYETWKRDIGIWAELTDLPKNKQALAIHLSLSGRARIATSELKVEDMKKDTGVDLIMKKLDDLFLPEKGQRQFSAFNNLYNFRRGPSVNINDFVSQFEHAYFTFTQEDMDLPDAVMAFMLLSSCNLQDNEVQLVMSAINKVTYNDMKLTIKRVFGQNICMQSTVREENVFIKSEPVFNCDSVRSETALNVRGGRGRPNRFRGGRGFTGRFLRNRGNKGPGDDSRGYGRRQLNPTDKDGQISRCLICDSKFHWAKDCPDSYENSASANFLENNNNSNAADVDLSLFVCLNSNEGGASKQEILVSESDKCALLDTGCSTTVCGQRWFNNYVEHLSDYEKSLIGDYHTDATFTFGDGKTVNSSKRVSLPCWIGGMKANITTDIVQCNVPLLLSKKSMKKAGMVINFKEDTLNVCGKTLKLKDTSSGHYLLDISL